MMLWSIVIVAACSFSRPVQGAVLPALEHTDVVDGVRNANHIFNAIHSSMRQWGSSVHHNGMSLFLAQVPAGTQFYHGTPSPDAVSGLEWLAFEPEHALNFARQIVMPPKRPPGPPPSETGNELPLEYHFPSDNVAEHHPQRPLLDIDDRSKAPTRPRIKPGWLHTYRTKERTALLYIDGMSAGKCEKGTLDTQDVLLLNATEERKGMFWEKERAERLCKMSKESWNGKIKGFIRMEAGFEIIMCSFSETLDFVQSVRAGPFSPEGSEPDPDDEPFGWKLWDWLKFIAARYDGIGGGRVKLNYDNFITSYNYDLDLFSADGDLPRLENLSDVSLNVVRNDITTMVTQWDPSSESDEEQTNWQSIADMVVQRYANELKFLVSDGLTTSAELLRELHLMLRGFVDSDHRNTTSEIERCVAQFNPAGVDMSRSVAGRAIRSVTETVCATLFEAFDANRTLTESREKLTSAMRYLDWTVWKKCAECPLNKVCFIPVWPFGAVEDYEHPQCRNGSELGGRTGYWGHSRPRGLDFETYGLR